MTRAGGSWTRRRSLARVFVFGMAVAALAGCASPLQRAAAECGQLYAQGTYEFGSCVQQQTAEIAAAQQSAGQAMMYYGYGMATQAPRTTVIVPPYYGPSYGPPPAPGVILQP